MFANVRWQPVYMYNTITSWYATMYHETSVILTHESLELRGHYHQISELRQRYHSHQEQYWNKKKSMFNSGWNHCKCFTRTQFLHWLKPEHHWKKKKNTVSFPEWATDCDLVAAQNKSGGLSIVICDHKERTALSENIQLLTNQGWRVSFTFHCFGRERVLWINKYWLSASLHTVHSVTNLWQRQLKSQMSSCNNK